MVFMEMDDDFNVRKRVIISRNLDVQVVIIQLRIVR
jgi:hypothetical protein